jgi:hypothetical protein
MYVYCNSIFTYHTSGLRGLYDVTVSVGIISISRHVSLSDVIMLYYNHIKLIL